MKTRMWFLHSVIHCKISLELNQATPETHNDNSDFHNKSQSQVSTTVLDPSTDALPGDPAIDANLDRATVISMGNLVFVKSLTKEQATHNLGKVHT